MDSIILLDDDDDEGKPEPSSSISLRPPSKRSTNAQAPTTTHITQSPFASAKKDRHVLQKENEKLFAEFVEHCKPHTTDCPEVLTFLQTVHSKTSPDFLSSVEFRNTLGSCLTKAQTRAAKTFVCIKDLCTVLKQHSAKRRKTFHTLPPAVKTQRKEGEPEGESPAEVTASTSGTQDGDEEKKIKRASRKQIAYLENLLKVYNDEIKRLQEKELCLNDLEKEDSSYIQEHKLKRKMMKIYDKLCELKSCSTLTGRVIEQRILYKGTRYPEINRKIERYINSPEVRLNPPDYRDILQLVQHANQRYSLSLNRNQMSQIARDAFQETGSRMQDRRHLDMVYNFGSHLTDAYKPNTDPALLDPTLARRLRSNREMAVSSLEEVISKYAMKQDDTEEEERKKRQKANLKKEDTSEVEKEKEVSGEEEDKGEDDEAEEDEGDEDDVSSDPDIEEEIQASHSQEGDEEDEEPEEPTNASDGENQGSEDLPSVKSSVLDEEEEEAGEEEGNSENDQQSLSSSHRGAFTDTSPADPPTVENSSPSDSPSQSEPTKTNVTEDNQWQSPISPSQPITTNSDSLPPSPVVVSTNQDLLLTTCDKKSINGHPSPSSPVGSDSAWKFKKRRRSVEIVGQPTSSKRQKADSMSGSESDIPLDMGADNSPLQADSAQADSPTQEMVSSSQMTPPPKANKVDAATQCDPEEVIVLSDSD